MVLPRCQTTLYPIMICVTMNKMFGAVGFLEKNESLNIKIVENLALKKNQCRCGRSTRYLVCNKMSCLCYKSKLSCSEDPRCGCRGCENPFGVLKKMPRKRGLGDGQKGESIPGPSKRKLISNSGDKLHHQTGSEYLQSIKESVRESRWDVVQCTVLRIIWGREAFYGNFSKAAKCLNICLGSLGSTCSISENQLRSKIRSIGKWKKAQA